jgi:hypothetical protein
MAMLVHQLLTESKSPGLQVTCHFIFFVFFSPIGRDEAERVVDWRGTFSLLFCHRAALFLQSVVS